MIAALLGLATVTTTICALAVCMPFGLGAAIYLSEYASRRARGFLKPALEVLAGIPIVVYGFFALTFVTPLPARTGTTAGTSAGTFPARCRHAARGPIRRQRMGRMDPDQAR